ncbi:MAG: DUF3450 family protein [Phycisphaerales bacterium]
MAYHRQSDVRSRPSRRLGRTLAIAAAATAIAALAAAVAPRQSPPASLEGARLTLSKWIETQQIIAKERNDWQQGKEILQGRIDLVGKEVGVLKERIRQSEEAVAQSDRKRDELLAQDAELKTLGEQLATAATVMEEQVRSLLKQLPDPVKGRIAPLVERIPADPAATRVTPAERFQNVLGILNEVNKANSEISVAYEIRTLADGSSSEVQVIYLGLAQAYFLSPKGEAGIGRPTEDGWKWEPAPGAADQILLALEVIEGKHVPTFVPLPIKIR